MIYRNVNVVKFMCGRSGLVSCIVSVLFCMIVVFGCCAFCATDVVVRFTSSVALIV